MDVAPSLEAIKARNRKVLYGLFLALGFETCALVIGCFNVTYFVFLHPEIPSSEFGTWFSFGTTVVACLITAYAVRRWKEFARQFEVEEERFNTSMAQFDLMRAESMASYNTRMDP